MSDTINHRNQPLVKAGQLQGQPRKCAMAGSRERYPPEDKEQIVELVRSRRTPGRLAREFACVRCSRRARASWFGLEGVVFGSRNCEKDTSESLATGLGRGGNGRMLDPRRNCEFPSECVFAAPGMSTIKSTTPASTCPTVQLKMSGERRCQGKPVSGHTPTPVYATNV